MVNYSRLTTNQLSQQVEETGLVPAHTGDISRNIWHIGYFNATCSIQQLEYSVAQLVEALRYKPEGRGLDGIIGMFH
jgi:hypothetical protein